MVSDTGESVAATNRRADDQAEPGVLGALKSGAVLRRPTGLPGYYTEGLPPGHRGNGQGLSAARVKRLATEGTLVLIGVDTYGLPRAAAPTSADPLVTKLVDALKAALPQLEGELANREFSQLGQDHEYIAPLAAVVKQVTEAINAAEGR